MNLLALILVCFIPLEAAQRSPRGAGRNRASIILSDHRPRKREKKYHSHRKPRIFRAPPVGEEEIDRLLQRHPCTSRESVVALVTGLVMVPDPLRDEE